MLPFLNHPECFWFTSKQITYEQNLLKLHGLNSVERTRKRISWVPAPIVWIKLCWNCKVFDVGWHFLKNKKACPWCSSWMRKLSISSFASKQKKKFDRNCVFSSVYDRSLSKFTEDTTGCLFRVVNKRRRPAISPAVWTFSPAGNW